MKAEHRTFQDIIYNIVYRHAIDQKFGVFWKISRRKGQSTVDFISIKSLTIILAMVIFQGISVEFSKYSVLI